MSDPFPVYYSLRDIAERLGFGHRTIQRWVADGTLGPRDEMIMVHGDMRVPWSVIQQFLQRSRLPNPAAAGDFSRVPEVSTRDIRERELQPGVAARTADELKRKVKR